MALLLEETPPPAAGLEHLAMPEKLNPNHPGLGLVWYEECLFQILSVRK